MSQQQKQQQQQHISGSSRQQAGAPTSSLASVAISSSSNGNYTLIQQFNSTNNRKDYRTSSNPVNGIRTDVDPSKIYAVSACLGATGEPRDISYSSLKAVGNGSFGVVFQATIIETGEQTAIKKVLQDKRFKVGSLLPLVSLT